MKTILKSALYIPFYNLLIFFAWLTNGSVGWAIVLLTVLIRLILLAPSLKSARATTLMQKLQPQMNAVKEKYKGDQKKQNAEIVKLYKQSGTSPLGCCLPLAIQFLVIIILYRVFGIGFDTSHYSLLYSFTPRPDSLNTIFLGFNMAKPDPWILPIIAGVTQFVLSLMTMPKQDKSKPAQNDAASMMNKQMIYFFPVITVLIGRSLQSGLIIYWIITTVFSIGQQWYVNKKIKTQNLEPKIIDPEDSQDNKDVPAIESGEVKPEDKKKGYLAKVMRRRLDKSDKKKGIEVTIRSKK